MLTDLLDCEKGLILISQNDSGQKEDNMTTRQLYYLVTIADCASLSKAAQVLGVSQPALSKFLTEYEDSLGFLLFLRYHRQLTPTAVGRYVIQCAQRILDEQTRMFQTLQAVTDSNHTRIRLATAPNRGAMIYSRIYKPFSQRYPNISLSLTELYASDQPGAIQRGQIDLAIGSGKVSTRVTDLPIAYEELLVSLPVSHPLAQAERIRLTNLRDTPFVLQGPRHSIRILAEELFQEAGFQPVVSFESNDVLLVDSMMHQAVGVGLVSQAHVFPCEELVYRSLDPPIHQTLRLRYPLGHTLTEPERYLAGLLTRERLNDPRYQPIDSPEVDELLRLANENTADTSDALSDAHTANAFSSTRYTAPELNLNTQLLQYIIAIVDEKSLTRAAEKFYLPQPALSRHLRNAEDMLCTRLFTRVHNRLQPTNAGKIFVNFARNMLQIEAEMTEHLRNYRVGHGGGIYLQCDPLLAPMVRKHVATSFQRLHPDIRLPLVEGSREETQEALLNASADYGLYFSCDRKHPILSSRILAESELVYCFGANWTADTWKGTSCAEEVLAAEAAGVCGDAQTGMNPDNTSPRPVMLAPAGSALRMEQDRLLSSLFETPPAVVCEAQLPFLQLLTQAGAADTILPVDLLPKEALPRCKSFRQPQTFSLLLVHHPGRHLPPSVQDLVWLLEDVFVNYFVYHSSNASTSWLVSTSIPTKSP